MRYAGGRDDWESKGRGQGETVRLALDGRQHKQNSTGKGR